MKALGLIFLLSMGAFCLASPDSSHTDIQGKSLQQMILDEVRRLVSRLFQEYATNNYTNDSPMIVQGRMTLVSGTPVTTVNETSLSTIYFTPYNGDKVSLYSGSIWQLFTFSETSLSISNAVSYPANTNFDIFIYNNSGTLTLTTINWTNGSTRATNLTTQNGVYVSSSNSTWRYLGTGRTTATAGQTEDSITNRYLWNLYNQVPKILVGSDNTSHTFGGTNFVYQAWNSSSVSKVNFVTGLVLTPLTITTTAGVNTGAYAGAGLDSVTSPVNSVYNSNTSLIVLSAVGIGYPLLGYNYAQGVESGSSASSNLTNVSIIFNLEN